MFIRNSSENSVWLNKNENLCHRKGHCKSRDFVGGFCELWIFKFMCLIMLNFSQPNSRKNRNLLVKKMQNNGVHMSFLNFNVSTLSVTDEWIVPLFFSYSLLKPLKYPDEFSFRVGNGKYVLNLFFERKMK